MSLQRQLFQAMPKGMNSNPEKNPVSSIQLLPSSVVDQIAAGEVVERPSHLVKELVENSLDAGATEIEVDFDHGGRWVKVKDNGKGIGSSDLKLAVARHATSKIHSASDIWNLFTYGFRGEALASISSVSRLELLSRPPQQAQAGFIKVEFGITSDPVPQGGDFGTTITIDELFGNIPARLKFLKSDGAESIHIKQCLKALALINPKITFRIRQQGKLIHYWSGQETPLSRVEQVLQVRPLYQGHYQEGVYQTDIFVSSPKQVEKSSRQIWLFVQGRWVQDRGMQAAVMEAYRNLLMHGEYPIAVVNLRCHPTEVDINIHPAKSAIKFQNPSLAFRVVQKNIRQILEKAPWIESPSKINSKSQAEDTISFQEFGNPTPSLITVQENKTRPPYNFPQGVSEEANSYTLADSSKVEILSQNFVPKKKPIKEMLPGISFNTPTEMNFVETKPWVEQNNFELVPSTFWQSLLVIGQAHQTYIVTQNEKHLILIDQHAAHERIVFERLMHSWTLNKPQAQQCLIPLTLDLEPHEIDVLKEQSSNLQKMGLSFDFSESEGVTLTALPLDLKEAAIVKALKKMLQEIYDLGGSFAMERLRADFCATLACHSVVRAGQNLSLEQMKHLLIQMDEFPLSSFCPHGRPVSLELSWTYLEKELGRIP
ncbi:MAG: DNA mismatch repair endonuclease MutL [Bdellovibrionales bacterium]|nr:DNA mismatch repair endonuclease MutL [Bdellovibrionales bacterium]